MSSSLECKGWHQEAALRMLRNNLHPEVAERPQDLIVYGGTGKAARNWDCYRAIEATLKRLANDETLFVQSGKPVKNMAAYMVVLRGTMKRGEPVEITVLRKGERVKVTVTPQ